MKFAFRLVALLALANLTASAAVGQTVLPVVAHVTSTPNVLVDQNGNPIGVGTTKTMTSGVAVNASTFKTVVVQVDNLSGGDTITCVGSIATGGTTYPLQEMSRTGTFGTISSAISSSGIYSLLGAGNLQVTCTQNGTASTPTLTVGLFN